MSVLISHFENIISCLVALKKVFAEKGNFDSFTKPVVYCQQTIQSNSNDTQLKSIIFVPVFQLLALNWYFYQPGSSTGSYLEKHQFLNFWNISRNTTARFHRRSR